MRQNNVDSLLYDGLFFFRKRSIPFHSIPGYENISFASISNLLDGYFHRIARLHPLNSNKLNQTAKFAAKIVCTGVWLMKCNHFSTNNSKRKIEKKHLERKFIFDFFFYFQFAFVEYWITFEQINWWMLLWNIGEWIGNFRAFWHCNVGFGMVGNFLEIMISSEMCEMIVFAIRLFPQEMISIKFRWFRSKLPKMRKISCAFRYAPLRYIVQCNDFRKNIHWPQHQSWHSLSKRNPCRKILS